MTHFSTLSGAELRNKKREAFCQEYLVDLCAAKAAVRAGYARKGAKNQGWQLLQRTEVQGRIKELMDARAQRCKITADDVVRELARIGFGSISDFIRIDDEGQPCVDLSRADPNNLAIVRNLRSEVVPDRKGGEARLIRKVRIGLYDKVRALELLGRHLGLFDTKEVQVIDTLAEAVKTISKKGSTSPIYTSSC